MPDENEFLAQNEIDDILARGGHLPKHEEAQADEQIPAVSGSDSGWVKCADRMPELTDEVDVWFIDGYGKGHRIANCKFMKDRFVGSNYHSTHYYLDNVTHWMPLPEPPNH